MNDLHSPNRRRSVILATACVLLLLLSSVLRYRAHRHPEQPVLEFAEQIFKQHWVGEVAPPPHFGRVFLRVHFPSDGKMETERVGVRRNEIRAQATPSIPWARSPLNKYDYSVIEKSDSRLLIMVTLRERCLTEADGSQTDVMNPKYAKPQKWLFRKSKSNSVEIVRDFAGKATTFVMRVGDE